MGGENEVLSRVTQLPLRFFCLIKNLPICLNAKEKAVNKIISAQDSHFPATISMPTLLTIRKCCLLKYDYQNVIVLL